jgi:hypothetical protein
MILTIAGAIIRNFIIAVFINISNNGTIKSNIMRRTTCSKHGRNEKCNQDFGRQN